MKEDINKDEILNKVLSELIVYEDASTNFDELFDKYTLERSDY